MENNHCYFSVVIPLYNKAYIIAKTIRSVLAQTFQDFEIIVVDDGSSDDGTSIVKSFGDKRIKIIHQENKGVSAARNRGIEEAKSDYIALLDADDEWKKDYLSMQYQLIKKYPECEIFVTNYEFRLTNGKILPTILNGISFNNDGLMNNYFKIASISHPPITSISVVIKKHLLQSIGGFPLGIRSGEDLLTWARLAVRSKIAYSLKVCAVYNLGEGYDFKNLPPRRQDIGDPVGKELVKLLNNYPDTAGLRDYVSHWHKMRASVAMRYGETMETLTEGIKCLRLNPFNYKVIPLMILSCLPRVIRIPLIARLKQ